MPGVHWVSFETWRNVGGITDGLFSFKKDKYLSRHHVNKLKVSNREAQEISEGLELLNSPVDYQYGRATYTDEIRCPVNFQHQHHQVGSSFCSVDSDTDSYRLV